MTPRTTVPVDCKGTQFRCRSEARSRGLKELFKSEIGEPRLPDNQTNLVLGQPGSSVPAPNPQHSSTASASAPASARSPGLSPSREPFSRSPTQRPRLSALLTRRRKVFQSRASEGEPIGDAGVLIPRHAPNGLKRVRIDFPVHIHGL